MSVDDTIGTLGSQLSEDNSYKCSKDGWKFLHVGMKLQKPQREIQTMNEYYQQ
jgi:hypothetical protein